MNPFEDVETFLLLLVAGVLLVITINGFDRRRAAKRARR
jgi:uncharacterized membrane protein YsdA (DUF1294 family)